MIETLLLIWLGFGVLSGIVGACFSGPPRRRMDRWQAREQREQNERTRQERYRRRHEPLVQQPLNEIERQLLIALTRRDLPPLDYGDLHR